MRKHLLDTPASYYAIFFAARLLPVRVCRLIADIVVAIVYSFSRRDRQGLAFNLSQAFGRPPGDAFIRRNVRRIFFNYGQYMADFFSMPQLPPAKARAHFSHIRGEEILDRALARGRGAILLSAHLGNWEFGGTMLGLSGYPLAVVALPHNSSATTALVNRLRQSKGIKVIEVDDSPFSGIDILRHLKRNGVVAMLGDRDFFGSGRPTRFFGKRVNFPVGPVTLALNSGAALIPAFVLKGTDGRYFSVLEPALRLVTAGSREQVLDANLARTAAVFETFIRRYPDQWYCPDPITAPARESLPR